MTEELKNGTGSDNADQDKAQTPEPDSVKTESMIPRARLNQEIEKRKTSEEALRAVVDDLKEDIPEDMRDLVPDLPPAEQVKWIRVAFKKGVFGGNQPQDGPDSKRPGGKPPQDFDNMTPLQMREAGYKT